MRETPIGLELRFFLFTTGTPIDEQRLQWSQISEGRTAARRRRAGAAGTRGTSSTFDHPHREHRASDRR